MSRELDALFDQVWRAANMDRRQRLNDLLDELAPADREIVVAILGITEPAYIKRPSLSKAAAIVGIHPRMLQRRIKRIRESIRKIRI